MALNVTAPLDFTDGDTLKRFTIQAPTLRTTTPPPLVSVYRQQVPDVDDPGWIFIPNVVSVANGSFDVVVAALSGDGTAGVNEFPNETVTLTYLLD